MCLPSAERWRISAGDSTAAEVAEQEVAGRGRALNFTLTLQAILLTSDTEAESQSSPKSSEIRYEFKPE